MKYLVFFLWIGLFTHWAHGVQRSDMEPIAVGDQLPEKLVTLLDLSSDRWTILHFWNTGCKYSSESIQQVARLQDQYEDHVTFVLVNTYDDREEIQGFLNDHLLGNMDFIQLNEELLEDYFPHRGVPFEVWIDDQYKLRARTSYSYLTSETLRRLVVEKEPVELHNSHYEEEPPREPLLRSNNTQLEEAPYYYHAVTGRRKGGGTSIGSYKGSMMYNNHSISRLYASAFGIPILQQETRMLIEVSEEDRRLLVGPERDSTIESLNAYQEWQDQYLFCYNWWVDQSKVGDHYGNYKEAMRSDLNDYFGLLLGIEGVMEKRERTCWVICRAENFSSGDIETSNTITLKSLSIRLERYFSSSGEPVIVADGLIGQINIDWWKQGLTRDQVKEYLNKEGYTLTKQQVMMDMLVIRYINKFPP